MADEFSGLEKALLFVATLMTGGVGAQEWRSRRHDKLHDKLDARINLLAEEVPKTYRSKEDCKDICGRIEKSFEQMSIRVETSIRDAQDSHRDDLLRIYDKGAYVKASCRRTTPDTPIWPVIKLCSKCGRQTMRENCICAGCEGYGDA